MSATFAQLTLRYCPLGDRRACGRTPMMYLPYSKFWNCLACCSSRVRRLTAAIGVHPLGSVGHSFPDTGQFKPVRLEQRVIRRIRQTAAVVCSSAILGDLFKGHADIRALASPVCSSSAGRFSFPDFRLRTQKLCRCETGRLFDCERQFNHRPFL